MARALTNFENARDLYGDNSSFAHWNLLFICLAAEKTILAVCMMIIIKIIKF